MMKMTKLTKQKGNCTHCGERKRLVIVRHRAWLCKKCYNGMLAERRAERRFLRELNKIAEEL